MTMRIHAVSEIDLSDLRSLVVDNLDTLLGEGARLVEHMPQIDNCCLATSDTHDRPVLLSFDAVDSQQALIKGLVRLDQLCSEMAALFLQDYHPPTELLVLAPEPPPGLRLFGGSCPVSWRCIQVLSVNGELGMVVSPVVDETAATALIPLESRHNIVEPALNPEEEQHFSHL